MSDSEDSSDASEENSSEENTDDDDEGNSNSDNSSETESGSDENSDSDDESGDSSNDDDDEDDDSSSSSNRKKKKKQSKSKKKSSKKKNGKKDKSKKKDSGKEGKNAVVKKEEDPHAMLVRELREKIWDLEKISLKMDSLMDSLTARYGSSEDNNNGNDQRSKQNRQNSVGGGGGSIVLKAPSTENDGKPSASDIVFGSPMKRRSSFYNHGRTKIMKDTGAGDSYVFPSYARPPTADELRTSRTERQKRRMKQMRKNSGDNHHHSKTRHRRVDDWDYVEIYDDKSHPQRYHQTTQPTLSELYQNFNQKQRQSREKSQMRRMRKHRENKYLSPEKSHRYHRRRLSNHDDDDDQQVRIKTNKLKQAHDLLVSGLTQSRMISNGRNKRRSKTAGENHNHQRQLTRLEQSQSTEPEIPRLNIPINMNFVEH